MLTSVTGSCKAHSLLCSASWWKRQMRPSYQLVGLVSYLHFFAQRDGRDAASSVDAYDRASFLLCLAAYRYIGATFGASPSQLGSITLTRALVQALTSPVGGLLGDRVDRTFLVAFGCILWGAMTAGIGLSHTLPQVRSLRCSQISAKMLFCSAFSGSWIGPREHVVPDVSMLQQLKKSGMIALRFDI